MISKFSNFSNTYVISKDCYSYVRKRNNLLIRKQTIREEETNYKMAIGSITNMEKAQNNKDITTNTNVSHTEKDILFLIIVCPFHFFIVVCGLRFTVSDNPLVVNAKWTSFQPYQGEKSYIRWDDDVRLVLDLYAQLDFYSSNLLKKQTNKQKPVFTRFLKKLWA